MMPSVRAIQKARKRLVVGRAEILRAAGVAQVGVLGADAGVVEPGGDRMCVRDLAVVLGEDRRAGAVQDSWRPEPSDAAPAASTPTSAPPRRDEPVEDPDRVRAAADARDHGIGQPSLGAEHLPARLAADDRLKFGDHSGYGAGPKHAPTGSVSSRVRDPVADRFAGRVLQRPRPEVHPPHLRAEQAHALTFGSCRRMSSSPM